MWSLTNIAVNKNYSFTGSLWLFLRRGRDYFMIPLSHIVIMQKVSASQPHFYFPFAFESELSTLRENKKVASATFCIYLRRGRDSNPRYPFEYTNFPGLLLKPLGHPSVFF